MSSPQTTQTDLDAVAQALREHDDYVITTHENPDGDALGSLIACKLALDQLGKRSQTYVCGTNELPREYAFMSLDGVRRGDPGDLVGHPLICVDAANEQRIGHEPRLVGEAPIVIDIDHHHDNSRYGSVNLVVGDASSTAEVLRDVIGALGLTLTPEMAEALYIAVVTDTGRFQYSNTTPKALRLAAELVEAGADVHRIFQQVYESIEFGKLKLLARVLEHAEVFEGGRLVISHLERKDFTETGGTSATSEGAIDSLRAVEGADMAALIQEPPDRDGRRISLRTSREAIDVSAIARKSGGGGHRQAAGFSSSEEIPAIAEFIRNEFRAQLLDA
ncbi:MAG: DHH family phosphoesterase [Gaiellaceae bacterium]